MPDDVAGLGESLFRLGALGQAEVGDPGRPGRVEQDVRRLDVAMQETAVVGVVQGLGDLEADAGDQSASGRGSTPRRTV